MVATLDYFLPFKCRRPRTGPRRRTKGRLGRHGFSFRVDCRNQEGLDAWREAKELVAGKPTEARTRKANVRRWLRRSAEFVRDTVSDWEPDERVLATEGLTRLMEQIRTAGGMALMRNGNSLNFTTQCDL